MRWSIRNFDTSPLLPNGHLIVVCSRGVEGCDLCVDGVGHLSWTSFFQAEYVFCYVIWGCSTKEFTFARRGLWRKGLQESRNRQSDLMAFSDLEDCKFSRKTIRWRARQHCLKTLWSLLKRTILKVARSVAIGCYVCFCCHNILSFALRTAKVSPGQYSALEFRYCWEIP